jgi:hypothetical protein
LKLVKKNLKGWGANIRGRDIKRKKELTQELSDLEEIEENLLLSRSQLIRKSQIQKELMQIYESEEAFWHQRGRENWLLQGDNNTKFFHRSASGQKRKRTMFSLMNGSEQIQGTPDLLSHATAFYKDLFGPQQLSHTRMREGSWSKAECLNDTERADLDRPFTEEEIKKS